jgi:hypothetical protein
MTTAQDKFNLILYFTRLIKMDRVAGVEPTTSEEAFLDGAFVSAIDFKTTSRATSPERVTVDFF